MVMSLLTRAVRMALTTAFIEREYPVTPAKKEAGKPRQDMIASWPLKCGFRLSAEKISASTTCKQQTGRFKLMWRIPTVSLPSAQDLYQVSRENRLAQRPLTPPSCAIWSPFFGNWTTGLWSQWTALHRKGLLQSYLEIIMMHGDFSWVPDNGGDCVTLLQRLVDQMLSSLPCSSKHSDLHSQTLAQMAQSDTVDSDPLAL